MSRILTRDEIAALGISERLDLIAALWDSIDPESLPVPDFHRRALDEAIADYAANPDDAEPWDRIRDDLFPKK